MSRPVNHQSLRRLVYFNAVAEAGSISGAARRLGLSVAVISDAVASLEAEMGVTLARRSTRHFSLTGEGEALRQTARQIVDLAEDAFDPVARSGPLTGTLHLTLPVELAAFWLPARIRAFNERHPDAGFVIHASDAIEMLGTSEIEIALRTRYSVVPSAKAGPMVRSLVLVATPDNAAKGLSGLTLIDHRRHASLEARDPTDGIARKLAFRRVLQIDNRFAALALARDGIGAVLVLRDSVEDDFSTGRLVELFPELDFGSIALEWVFRDRRPSRLARAFIECCNAMD